MLWFAYFLVTAGVNDLHIYDDQCGSHSCGCHCVGWHTDVGCQIGGSPLGFGV
jgi:hypothetical protein